MKISWVCVGRHMGYVGILPKGCIGYSIPSYTRHIIFTIRGSTKHKFLLFFPSPPSNSTQFRVMLSIYAGFLESISFHQLHELTITPIVDILHTRYILLLNEKSPSFHEKYSWKNVKTEYPFQSSAFTVMWWLGDGKGGDGVRGCPAAASIPQTSSFLLNNIIIYQWKEHKISRVVKPLMLLCYKHLYP